MKPFRSKPTIRCCTSNLWVCNPMGAIRKSSPFRVQRNSFGGCSFNHFSRERFLLPERLWAQEMPFYKFLRSSSSAYTHALGGGKGMEDFAKRQAAQIRYAEEQRNKSAIQANSESQVFVERENLKRKLGPDLWLSFRELLGR